MQGYIGYARAIPQIAANIRRAITEFGRADQFTRLASQRMETIERLFNADNSTALYRSIDAKALEEYRDGVTTVGGTNVREGIVVRSMIPGDHPVHGRKIAKFISPAYLLRKVKNGEATEYN